MQFFPPQKGPYTISSGFLFCSHSAKIRHKKKKKKKKKICGEENHKNTIMAVLGALPTQIFFFFVLFLYYCFCFNLGVPDAAVLRVAAAMAQASLIDLLIAQALSSFSSSSSSSSSSVCVYWNLGLLLLSNLEDSFFL
jgi:hypothetical protein